MEIYGAVVYKEMVAVPKRARVRRPPPPVKQKQNKRKKQKRNEDSESENEKYDEFINVGSDIEETTEEGPGINGKHLRLQAVFHTLEDLALFAGVPCAVRQFFDGGLGVSK